MARDKKKKGKDDPATPRAEIDAVKGFIVVMLVLIVALGVFIVITKNELSEYETAIAQSKPQVRKLGTDSLKVRAYLDLIKGSKETVLQNYPEQYFGNIYRSSDIGIPQGRVKLDGPKSERNNREKYTEISWELDFEDVDRKQATLFLYGVEKNSPKARIIEISLRRNRKKDARPDSWDANFSVGYRVAGTAR
jgi:hypothetical protein